MLPSLQDSPGEHEPAEQDHDPDADDARVVAHVAGLTLAELAGAPRTARADPSTAPSMTVWSNHAIASNSLRPGPPMNALTVASYRYPSASNSGSIAFALCLAYTAIPAAIPISAAAVAMIASRPRLS